MRNVGLWAMVIVCTGLVMDGEGARGDAFTDYYHSESLTLPAAAPVDVLGDGRLITMAGDTVLVESAVGSRTFGSIGTLPGADIGSFGPGFLRVSPDGLQLAVGNNGGASFNNYEIGVFSLGTLSGGWFDASHYDAEWIDDTYLAVAGGEFGQPAHVTAVDSTTISTAVSATVLVENIGGASAGITFDAFGNLYTGNGYAIGGPSDTGAIREFDAADWMAALSGGAALDFENDGLTIADVLSANSLGFDNEGNLHVGGGDYLGGQETDNAALVRNSAVSAALGGFGPADSNDPSQVRRFDPDSASNANFYDVNYNAVTQELLIRDGESLYVYAVPEPATLGMILVAGATVVLWSSRRGARPREEGSAGVGRGCGTCESLRSVVS